MWLPFFSGPPYIWRTTVRHDNTSYPQSEEEPTDDSTDDSADDADDENEEVVTC